jgi:hypothetical protein
MRSNLDFQSYMRHPMAELLDVLVPGGAVILVYLYN